LDLGCGHGLPISRALADEGLHLFGIDASPTLVAAYRQNLPGSTVECSLAELSPFFHRSFGAAVAWGLLFLLSPDNQKRVIRNVGAALVAGDRFLFTAPHQAVTWEDSLTGQTSISLGRSTYHQLVAEAGMYVEDEADDDGGNHYYFARKLDPTIAAGPQTS
jgi:SAM-dependent methyltransferase